MSDEIIRKILMKLKLKVNLNKSEQALRDDLVRWHKNSNSNNRNFFIGEKKEK